MGTGPFHVPSKTIGQALMDLGYGVVGFTHRPHSSIELSTYFFRETLEAVVPEEQPSPQGGERHLRPPIPCHEQRKIFELKQVSCLIRRSIHGDDSPYDERWKRAGNWEL